MTQIPELLLPVGSMDMALAAIHNGADAIFIGVPGFNARGRSHDFEIEALQEMITLCHSYRVKVNLAFNILIFESELPAVVDLLEKLLPLKPDAFIVQDLGLAQIIRKMSPEQRIHASTQMTVTNYESIQLLEDLNIQRFVLGRENSIDDIKLIRNNTNKELEVFVHGALCVSYSGQCFTSESLGGRSANRGQCAQSCRFSYELQVDGEIRPLGDKKYLVSPQDLCGLNEIPELISSGVNCFKIEGRLKTPEYVATSAKAYRAQIDRTIENKSLSSSELTQLQKNMSTSYSRGFFSGWLHGVNHQKLVNGKYSSHRGYPVGTIVSVYDNKLTVQISEPSSMQELAPGDGLFACKGDIEQGGFIYSLQWINPKKMQIEFANNQIFSSDLLGGVLYQNHDKELKKQVQQSVTDKEKKKRLGIQVVISMALHEPLQATISDGEFTVTGQTLTPLSVAQSKPLSEEILREEFNSLSGSLFKLDSLSVNRTEASGTQEPLFLALKELKRLRQSLIEELTQKRLIQNSNFNPSTNASAMQINDWINKTQTSSETAPPRFNVLLRDKGQVQDLAEAFKQNLINPNAINTVFLDFEFGRDYEQSLELLRTTSPVKVGLATTRILKPNEHRNLKYLYNLKPDAILVRNLGALQYFKSLESNNIDYIGDFSLNVTNHLTADYLFQKGLSQVNLSYDLNHQQILDLLTHTSGEKCEITLFQYMPSFHMEHCVFAAFLSEGTSFRDCGKPCEKHDVRLKDQFQNWHQIKADQECRNTMYNAKPQSAARYLEAWTKLGLGAVRYEALKECGEELISKLQAHIHFLEGKISSESLLTSLGTKESYGLNEGPIAKTKEYHSKKKFESQRL